MKVACNALKAKIEKKIISILLRDILKLMEHPEYGESQRHNPSADRQQV